jgi:nucleoside-diphosphate-sugar epimerase
MIGNLPCELTECRQLWDFLYVDDAIDALYRLICKDKACGVYNFGSGISKELREYVMTMYRLTGSRSELRFGAVPYPKTGIVHTNPDVGRLLRETSWSPTVSFEEGIERLIRASINK